ncbi:MAG: lipid A biosynthesis lauroyl acyltransferase [Proteobacteria bacterium]|nr:lipid A biosynthesis lauroyl acyltransferase [Pseudomonadota bacterium]
MRRSARHWLAFQVWRIKFAVNKRLGPVAAWLLQTLRRTDRRRAAEIGAYFARGIGPWTPEQKTGRANLAAAFPEKSRTEITAILRGVWDNLGRVAAEFPHIDRMRTRQAGETDGYDITYDDLTAQRFETLRGSERPILIFAAHLANWELPALVAAQHGLETTVLYRPPNIGAIKDAILDIRARSMGNLMPTSFDAPLRLANILANGGRVAMLVDQHFGHGIDVNFFGRRCKVNPLIAKLARQFDCPVHGVRIVRLADRGRFLAELTDPIIEHRAADGRLDIGGTMQEITARVEAWIREYPDQWLWLHRRWR